MNKTNRIEFRRVFLLADLPAPLTRASEHLQIFDNYVENTRLRLRSIRAPHTKEWFWILEQRNQMDANDLSVWEVSEIHLNEAEHQAFEMFEGREVKKNERVETNELRFNRYAFEANSKLTEIDFFLNPLWGLCLAKVLFQMERYLRNCKAAIIYEGTRDIHTLMQADWALGLKREKPARIILPPYKPTDAKEMKA